jgi:hypothetical protein
MFTKANIKRNTNVLNFLWLLTDVQWKGVWISSNNDTDTFKVCDIFKKRLKGLKLHNKNKNVEAFSSCFFSVCKSGMYMQTTVLQEIVNAWEPYSCT